MRAQGIMSSPRDHEFSKTGGLQASPKAIGGRIQKHILLAEGQQRVCVCVRTRDHKFTKGSWVQ